MFKDHINILIKLQGIDSEIFRLKKDRDLKPKEILPLKDRIHGISLQLEQITKQLNSLRLVQKEKEVDLQSKESNIKKLSLQLYQLKTNKEYAAMQKEIDDLKADSSLLEEEIINLIDKIRAVELELENKNKDIALQENKFKEVSKQIEDEIKHLDSQILQLESERDKVIPLIEKSILLRYERILHNKDGMALASAEDGICHGCNIGLTPQTFNEIKIGEKILTCESCNRILYISADFQEDGAN